MGFLKPSLTATALAVALAATVGIQGVAEAKSLRYAEFGPNRGARAAALQWFADEIGNQSGGKLSVEFQWGGALLKARAVLKGLGDGVADMGSISAAYNPKEMQLYGIGDLPIDNSDVWVGMRAMYELATTNPHLQKAFDAQNVVYITNYSTGSVQLVCKKPIDSLAALEGVKLCGTGPYAKTFADVGASVQRLPQPEVYQALDSGLLDCNQNYFYSIKAYRQYEVAPYVMELDWGQNMGFGIVMGKNAFGRLSAAEQKAVRDAGSAFIDHYAKGIVDANARDKKAMAAGIDGKKTTLVTFPTDQKKALLNAGSKYVSGWVDMATKGGAPGQAIMDDYRRLIAKYAKERDTKGYPWNR